MNEVKEGLKIRGEVIVEEINPVTREVISREVAPNIICVDGATTLAWAITSAVPPAWFNYMNLSTDFAAVSRATTTLPGYNRCSTLITPTVLGSVTTWTNLFVAQAGASPIWKFGMTQRAANTGLLWNAVLFGASKDNTNNDMQVTYNASFAP